MNPRLIVLKTSIINQGFSPGEKASFNGTVYEVVDNQLLRERVRQQADLTKLCTSLVTDMSGEPHVCAVHIKSSYRQLGTKQGEDDAEHVSRFVFQSAHRELGCISGSGHGLSIFQFFFQSAHRAVEGIQGQGHELHVF